MRRVAGLLLAPTLLISGLAFAAEPEALYRGTCVACHGANGQGALPGVPDLATRMDKADAVLVASIFDGMQSPGSPLPMPAKGGNPAITPADAEALVVYLRQLTRR